MGIGQRKMLKEMNKIKHYTLMNQSASAIGMSRAGSYKSNNVDANAKQLNREGSNETSEGYQELGRLETSKNLNKLIVQDQDVQPQDVIPIVN